MLVSRRPEGSSEGNGGGPPPPRVAVLIPALNEEEALPGLLASLPEPIHVVVVADNGSTDGTARVARAAGAEVVTEPARGYGAACLAGIHTLRERLEPSDVVVFVDADQVVEPAAFRTVCDPVREGRADLVVGVRVDPGGGVGTLMPHARVGNRVVLAAARALFGRRWRDLGPFRAIRLGALEELEMDDVNWGWTLQMQVRAHLRGLRVEEVDVPHHTRTVGESKITGSLLTSVRVGVKMFYTLVRERLRSL